MISITICFISIRMGLLKCMKMALMVDTSALDLLQCESHYVTNIESKWVPTDQNTVWKNRKSDAKITAQAISTFLWFFLLNVFFGYIWWQIWVYFDFEAFLTVQWSPKVECPTQILTFSSFLPVFFVFLYHCGHLAHNAPQCTP